MGSETVAVIGCGFSGIAVAANLHHVACTKKKQLRIELFGPAPGENPIYSTTMLPDSYRLNHSADTMGRLAVRSDEPGPGSPDDFFQWIQLRKDAALRCLPGTTVAERYSGCDLSTPGYFPRSLFGLYQEDKLDELIDMSRGKLAEVRHRTSAEVNEVEKSHCGDGFVLRFASAADGTEATPFTADYVVLCTGHPFSACAPCVQAMYEGWHPSTFLGSASAMSPIKMGDSVGILGSSLTAVEAAIELVRRGHRDITMFSRNGRLPKVRGAFQDVAFPRLEDSFQQLGDSSLPLDTAIAWLKREFDAKYATEAFPGDYYSCGEAGKGVNWAAVLSNVDPLGQFRSDVAAVKRGNELPWRSVLMSLENFEIRFWNAISSEDKAKVLKTYQSWMLLHLAPMPLKQAEEFLGYLDQGIVRLKSHVLHHQRDDANSGGWKVHCGGGGDDTCVKHLIDARGTPSNFASDSLIGRALESGLLAPHDFAGIRIEQRTFRCRDPQGKPQMRLFAVGPMHMGEYPLQTATIFLDGFARTAANNLVDTMK